MQKFLALAAVIVGIFAFYMAFGDPKFLGDIQREAQNVLSGFQIGQSLWFLIGAACGGYVIYYIVNSGRAH